MLIAVVNLLGYPQAVTHFDFLEATFFCLNVVNI